MPTGLRAIFMSETGRPVETKISWQMLSAVAVLLNGL